MNKEKRLARAKQKQKENRVHKGNNPSNIGYKGGFRSVEAAVKSAVFSTKEYVDIKKKAEAGGLSGKIAEAKLIALNKQIDDVVNKVKAGESAEDIKKEFESKTGYKIANFFRNIKERL